MATGLSTYLENVWLNWVRGVSTTPPSAFFGKLHLGDPSTTGANPSQNTTRMQITDSAAAGGQIALSANVSWTNMPAVETISHVSFWDSPSAPTGAGAVASTTGGTLAANTYYYVVTATVTGGSESVKSNEVSVTTTGSTSSVAITAPAVAGATGWRIYRGTSAGSENTYYTVGSGGALSFTDTGAAGTSASPPTGPGNLLWTFPLTTPVQVAAGGTFTLNSETLSLGPTAA